MGGEEAKEGIGGCLGAPPPEERGDGLNHLPGQQAREGDPVSKGAERRSESEGREGLGTGGT